MVQRRYSRTVTLIAIHSCGDGARFGALIGLILAIPLNVLFVGMFGVGLGAVYVDLPWHVIEEGATGAAIGLVYGAVKK